MNLFGTQQDTIYPVTKSALRPIRPKLKDIIESILSNKVS